MVTVTGRVTEMRGKKEDRESMGAHFLVRTITNASNQRKFYSVSA
jgi:hypothetical protein